MTKQKGTFLKGAFFIGIRREFSDFVNETLQL